VIIFVYSFKFGKKKKFIKNEIYSGINYATLVCFIYIYIFLKIFKYFVETLRANIGETIS